MIRKRSSDFINLSTTKSLAARSRLNSYVISSEKLADCKPRTPRSIQARLVGKDVSTPMFGGTGSRTPRFDHTRERRQTNIASRLEKELSELVVKHMVESNTRVRLMRKDLAELTADTGVEIRRLCGNRPDILLLLGTSGDTTLGVYTRKGFGPGADEGMETAYWIVEDGELSVCIPKAADAYLNDDGFGISLRKGAKYFAVDFAHPEKIALPADELSPSAEPKVLEVRYIEVYSIT